MDISKPCSPLWYPLIRDIINFQSELLSFLSEKKNLHNSTTNSGYWNKTVFLFDQLTVTECLYNFKVSMQRKTMNTVNVTRITNIFISIYIYIFFTLLTNLNTEWRPGDLLHVNVTWTIIKRLRVIWLVSKY